MDNRPEDEYHVGYEKRLEKKIRELEKEIDEKRQMVSKYHLGLCRIASIMEQRHGRIPAIRQILNEYRVGYEKRMEKKIRELEKETDEIKKEPAGEKINPICVTCIKKCKNIFVEKSNTDERCTEYEGGGELDARIFRVERCVQCPYCQPSTEQGKHLCLKTYPPKDCGDCSEIPKWCPLAEGR